MPTASRLSHFGIVAFQTALLSQEDSEIVKRSREGWFQIAILQVAALEPPRRFAPPLLTQEGSVRLSFNWSPYSLRTLRFTPHPDHFSGCSPSPFRRRQPWASVVQAEQIHDGLDVRLTANVIGHPSRRWMKVMQVRLPTLHQLLTNPYRERQVRQPLTMQMANLPPAHVEKNHSAAMCFRRNTHP
jgi:hypothetical protein